MNEEIRIAREKGRKRGWLIGLFFEPIDNGSDESWRWRRSCIEEAPWLLTTDAWHDISVILGYNDDA